MIWKDSKSLANFLRICGTKSLNENWYNKLWQKVNQKFTGQFSEKLSTALHSILCKQTVTNRINLSLTLGVNILQQETGSIRSVGPLVVNLYLRGHTFCF